MEEPIKVKNPFYEKPDSEPEQEREEVKDPYSDKTVRFTDNGLHENDFYSEDQSPEFIKNIDFRLNSYGDGQKCPVNTELIEEDLEDDYS